MLKVLKIVPAHAFPPDTMGELKEKGKNKITIDIAAQSGFWYSRQFLPAGSSLPSHLYSMWKQE